MTVRNRPIERFLVVAALVSVVDLLTKYWATVSIPASGIRIGGPVDLALTYNLGSAFGISFNTFPWQLNALATLATLGLAGAAVRALSRIDDRAPIALGLIAGAATGNLASMLAPPAGVADFIAVQMSANRRIVMNLADVAAYAGVAMMLRSLVLLRRAIGVERTVRPRIRHEVEIGIPVMVESGMGVPRSGPAEQRERTNGLSIDLSVPDRLDHSR
ncbi:MAG: signal peptidase II [Gemmatimonadaceae bacterium]